MFGRMRMAPLLMEVIKCMAMMKSVESRAPRPLVSERAQICPSTSFGSRALSNTDLAMSPSNVSSLVLRSIEMSNATYRPACRSARPPFGTGLRILGLFPGTVEVHG